MSQPTTRAVQIDLSQEDERFLLDLAGRVIVRGFAGGGPPGGADTPKPLSVTLKKPGGAFVTLEKSGRLRGCIGTLKPIQPLYLTVADMAWAAAFSDRRFPVLTREEWPEITYEISILGEISICPDVGLIELGRHGIMLRAGGLSAVFLPQVPVEQGWDLPATMAQLCRKAGLPAGAWKNEDTAIFWYEAKIIS